jgi:hypothetical protein
MEEFTIIPPTEEAARKQGLGRIDRTIIEVVGPLVEEDSAVVEAVTLPIMTVVFLTQLSLTHMIKGRLKAIWASTLITTLAHKIPTTRTAVVIMVVECPPLSSMSNPSQMVMPRATVIMKVRLKLRLKHARIQAEL